MVAPTVLKMAAKLEPKLTSGVASTVALQSQPLAGPSDMFISLVPDLESSSSDTIMSANVSVPSTPPTSSVPLAEVPTLRCSSCLVAVVVLSLALSPKTTCDDGHSSEPDTRCKIGFE